MKKLQINSSPSRGHASVHTHNKVHVNPLLSLPQTNPLFFVQPHTQKREGRREKRKNSPLNRKFYLFARSETLGARKEKILQSKQRVHPPRCPPPNPPKRSLQTDSAPPAKRKIPRGAPKMSLLLFALSISLPSRFPAVQKPGQRSKTDRQQGRFRRERGGEGNQK